MSHNDKADGLFGIKAIAEHVGMTKRQALYRFELGQLPAAKMGRTICASRSKLDAWLATLTSASRRDAAGSAA